MPEEHHGRSNRAQASAQRLRLVKWWRRWRQQQQKKKKKKKRMEKTEDRKKKEKQKKKEKIESQKALKETQREESRRQFRSQVEDSLHLLVPAVKELKEDSQKAIYENSNARDTFLRTLVLELLLCQLKYPWNEVEHYQKKADRLWHELAGWRHPAYARKDDLWSVQEEEEDSDEISIPEDFEGADEEWRDPFDLCREEEEDFMDFMRSD